MRELRYTELSNLSKDSKLVTGKDGILSGAGALRWVPINRIKWMKQTLG